MVDVHPQIYNIILKCYYHLNGASYEYFLEILRIFPLSKKFDLEKAKEEYRKKIAKETRDDPEALKEFESSVWSLKEHWGKIYESLLNYLKSLPKEDIFRILSDLLGDSRLNQLEHDFWNYHGDYVKDWPKQLEHSLKICGITYDKEKREFITEDKKFDIQKAISTPDLIQIEFKNIFYRELKEEINKCYKLGAFTATFILSRKLIENLLIDVLRLKFPVNKGNLEIYYRTDKKRFNDFAVLLENLENKKNEFGIDKENIEEFLKLVKPFRPSANSNAHSLIIRGKKEEIDFYQIERMAGLLIRLKQNISSAPPNNSQVLKSPL